MNFGILKDRKHESEKFYRSSECCTSCAKKYVKIVENIPFGECLLVCMYQGHLDSVIRVNVVFIKLEAFIGMMQF